MILRTFYGFLVFGLEEMFQEERTERERVFLGGQIGHAREQKRQANKTKISYLILLEITARTMEHSKCILNECIEM